MIEFIVVGLVARVVKLEELGTGKYQSGSGVGATPVLMGPIMIALPGLVYPPVMSNWLASTTPKLCCVYAAGSTESTMIGVLSTENAGELTSSVPARRQQNQADLHRLAPSHCPCLYAQILLREHPAKTRAEIRLNDHFDITGLARERARLGRDIDRNAAGRHAVGLSRRDRRGLRR